MALDRTIDAAYQRAAGSGWRGADPNGAMAGLLIAFFTMAGCQCDGRPLIVTALLLALPAVMVIVLMTRRVWLAAGYLFAVGVLLRLGLLVGFFGVPPAGVASDVLTVTEEAIATLVRGANPYTHLYTSTWGHDPLPFYAYGPGAILYYLPGFLLGNVRYMEIVAAAIVLGGFAWAARLTRSTWPLALMGAYAAAPPLVTLSQDNSNDTGIGGLKFVAAFVLLLARRYRSSRLLLLSAVILGWTLGYKGYAVALWPFFVAYLTSESWDLRLRLRSRSWTVPAWAGYAAASVGTTALLVLPFFVWSPMAMVRGLVEGAQFAQMQAHGGWNVWGALAAWTNWDAGEIFGLEIAEMSMVLMGVVMAVWLRVGVRRPSHALLGGTVAWFTLMFFARFTTYAYFAGLAPMAMLIPLADELAGVEDESGPVPNAPHRLMDASGGISAVLPAYNEEAALAGTVAGLRSVLARLGRPFEIIVVDDGSSDGTPALADRLAREDPAVCVVHHRHNQGYGAALKSGFAAARQDWVFLMDSDGQFDPAELPAFVDEASHADFVLGYRPERADPPHRRIFAKAWARMMRLLLGVGARDVDCAFKLMRRSYLAAMPLEAGGAFLSAEMLAKAGRLGARFAERPVKHLPRRAGRQTGGSVKVLLRAFYELGRLWLRVRRFKPPRLSTVSS
jgi:hypothetical protein